ncbi:hypothetical protein Cob_v002807 [Colletotrichum orbiculare MAFF 240422]|uniref:Uncharacterized protein n=1 Tax=Colletotrichum orbiculare (strain 104-T / ATCC 96160 / CBS 514.97 / LARS 414 / MAFF 240422) TaxID=1213857 RepID=A0A484G1D8_COLOR|nr:hypothetical protein Cob_v002807 [Colletotrichum orbiculare MAFF 240422]
MDGTSPRALDHLHCRYVLHIVLAVYLPTNQPLLKVQGSLLTWDAALVPDHRLHDVQITLKGPADGWQDARRKIGGARKAATGTEITALNTYRQREQDVKCLQDAAMQRQPG